MLTSLLLLQAINTERSYYHEPPLKPAHVLQVAAQAKVNDEAKRHYFAHISPQGKGPWEWIGFNNNYTVVGENLAEGYNTTSSLVQAWMNSPTHRENILEPYWKVTGFGIVQEGKVTLVSEEFGD